MLKPGHGAQGWIAIVAAVLLLAWLISAGLAALVVGLLFPGGFLIAP